MKRHIILAAAMGIVASPFAMAAIDTSRLTQEPVASATKADTDDALATSIVQALNAEASLKSAKIVVQPDKDVVYLTGAAMTKAQRQKASEIATAQAGEGKVVNAIVDDET